VLARMGRFRWPQLLIELGLLGSGSSGPDFSTSRFPAYPSAPAGARVTFTPRASLSISQSSAAVCRGMGRRPSLHWRPEEAVNFSKEPVADCQRAVVDHAAEYARGNVHTNTVGNFWRVVKTPTARHLDQR